MESFSEKGALVVEVGPYKLTEVMTKNEKAPYGIEGSGDFIDWSGKVYSISELKEIGNKNKWRVSSYYQQFSDDEAA